ncbi:unnamed protein product (macronuclear) [Paramecium tetraurelia]|uniref:DBF4-type domain-containing protein n=1 Tax=Paramecium tetraurelia TaxID=5888 RepID=A0BWQ8_PARTE|nr:uncharacterized protein GSPATT00032827001 [Paramecium tetraurelia]CAK62975.1 unnamed protein product [Paramecium tetraurelia]|eukprot:XP_001430373.1 hypothetical protein (macronuclear) [Paramecium tetraurelia strain d4-2]
MAGEKISGQGKRKCQPRCPEHQFNLHPKSLKCWLKQSTNIDFCPLYNDALACFQNIVPVFNQDEQQCLPGFILEVDRNDYLRSMQKYKEDHQRKIQEYTMKKTKLQIPKPGRKHRYCGVCRKPYADYLEHIKSSDHINCFNRHDFVHVILKIIDEDYKSRDENKIQNDSSTYTPKAVMPKKRGPKPKVQVEQGEPKKRGRKPLEPQAAKRIKTQPQMREVLMPVRQQQPPPPPPPPQTYFPQPYYFQYHPLNQMIQYGALQIPPQFRVGFPFQMPVVADMQMEMKCEDMIVDGKIEDRPQFD